MFKLFLGVYVHIIYQKKSSKVAKQHRSDIFLLEDLD